MDNELMHLIEKVETLQTQNERYRVALLEIIDKSFLWSKVEAIAQQALKEAK